MSNSPSVRPRSKHTDIRYKNVKQAVNEKMIKLVYCESANNSADGLTKVLGPTKHEVACKLWGIT